MRDKAENEKTSHVSLQRLDFILKVKGSTEGSQAGTLEVPTPNPSEGQYMGTETCFASDFEFLPRKKNDSPFAKASPSSGEWDKNLELWVFNFTDSTFSGMIPTQETTLEFPPCH